MAQKTHFLYDVISIAFFIGFVVLLLFINKQLALNTSFLGIASAVVCQIFTVFVVVVVLFLYHWGAAGNGSWEPTTLYRAMIHDITSCVWLLLPATCVVGYLVVTIADPKSEHLRTQFAMGPPVILILLILVRVIEHVINPVTEAHMITQEKKFTF